MAVTHRRQRRSADVRRLAEPRPPLRAARASSTTRAARPPRAPDRYGLWMDDCSAAEQIPQIPGTPVGIVGLRRFDNPAFDAARWNLQAYLADRIDRAAVPGRHVVRVLPRRVQSGQPAGRPESRGMGEPLADDRQSVLRGRQAVQPQHDAVRLPVARREPAAARHVRHVAIRDRSHRQPECDQHDLQPAVPAGVSGEDARRVHAPGAATSSRTAPTRSASPARRFAST